MERIKRGEMRAEQYRRKKQKKLVLRLSTLFMVLAAIFVIIFAFLKKSKTYESYRLSRKAEWNMTTDTSYLPYKSGLLKFNRDGAEAISQSGQTLWNVTYNMKDPIADVSGSYAIIADRGGKQFCIIDGSGTANRIEVLNNITYIDIAQQGVAAVMMSNVGKDYVELYSMDSVSGGTALANGETSVLTDGFPLDLAISKDGKKLITSYMRLVEDSLENWVTFYNFGEVGKSMFDHIAGNYKQGEALAPQIEFLTNDIVLVCRNDGFLLYTMQEIPKARAITSIEEKIEHITWSDSYICVVLKNTSNEGKHRVQLYNFNGKKQLDIVINDDFERILLSGEDIVFYSRLSCVIYTTHGKEKFRGNFDRNVEQIYPINNEDEYLLIGDGTMDLMKLIEAKN